jgi:hypothetical protein
MTFLAPQQRYKLHADCGNTYGELRNQVRILRLIECSSDRPAEELMARLKEFDARRNELNASSPIIPERAFEKARHGIEDGQKTHQADQPTHKRS